MIKDIIELLKFFVSNGVPIVLLLQVAVIVFLVSKYLEAKYGYTLFKRKNGGCNGIGTDSGIPGTPPGSVPAGAVAGAGGGGQYVTYPVCSANKAEIRREITDLQKSINEIKGSTEVIQKIVVSTLGKRRE